MVEIKNVVMFLLGLFLTAFYSLLVAGKIAFAYIFQRDTKFWVVKKRFDPPRSLTSNEFGEHKFMTVNVSNRFDKIGG